MLQAKEKVYKSRDAEAVPTSPSPRKIHQHRIHDTLSKEFYIFSGLFSQNPKSQIDLSESQFQEGYFWDFSKVPKSLYDRKMNLG
jgi:hypothetical protein